METPKLIYNPVFVDARGTFAPLPTKFGDSYLKCLIKDWLQSNISVNPNKYTLRGLHYQLEPCAQNKLIKVITGSIIDFVVDLRLESETYGKCFIFNVEPSNELYVPKGFAHGFITTEDNTVVQYLVDEKYLPSSERSLLWSSVPEVVNALSGFNPDTILISDKDKVCQTLEEKILADKFGG
jgi:dTDP-4-dehydrorhamnose 3,5-epimerase